ncbi:MAG: histidinol-phosphate transaminase [Paraperlucidibaca sp.]
MSGFLAQARLGVQGLAPYQPGKPVDELQRELGLTRVVKLASNENPLGPSPKALAAMQQALAKPLELGRYPDGSGFRLKQAIAQRFGCAIDAITLGNGSNDLLDIIARVFLGEGDEAIYAQYAFAVYPLSVQAVGATGVCVPAHDYGHDLHAMAQAISAKTKVIFLANPNNPTGTWFEADDFHAFMAKVPSHIVVVLDEAYGEFVTDPSALNGLAQLSRYANLIVTRTLAKAYGLASLRVGYAVASADISGLLNRVRQPFNVNSLALIAAEAAITDDAFVQKTRELNDAGMAQWLDALHALALKSIPSRGNFLCVDAGVEAMPVFQALLREGVIVRPVANYGLPNHLRISIGTEDENSFAISALTRVLNARMAV